jgi:hypothetical protein
MSSYTETSVNADARAETASSALLLASNRLALKQPDQATAVRYPQAPSLPLLYLGKSGRNLLQTCSYRRARVLWERNSGVALEP